MKVRGRRAAAGRVSYAEEPDSEDDAAASEEQEREEEEEVEEEEEEEEEAELRSRRWTRRGPGRDGEEAAPAAAEDGDDEVVADKADLEEVEVEVEAEEEEDEDEEDDDDEEDVISEEEEKDDDDADEEEPESDGADDSDYENNVARPAPRRRAPRRASTPLSPSSEDDEKDSGDDGDEREQDSEEEIEEKANARRRRSSRGASSSRGQEQRSSRRAVPRVSYAEEEDSEEDVVVTAKETKPALEEEDEDVDQIEKVLWHQVLGTGAQLQGGHMNRIQQDSNLKAKIKWEEQEFFIKWKGQSYLHCSWEPLAVLLKMSGHKKVVNYMRKVDEDRRMRQTLSPEEAELYDVTTEMELDLLKQYCEHFCREPDTGISFAQDAIDEFKSREAAVSRHGKQVDAQRRQAKGRLQMLEEQPEWLRGGQLRDYQLAGLNFMINSWRTDTNIILADEMGLGKTIQSVSMLGFLQNELEIQGPFLVVVPLSTLSNWAKEFRKWLPDTNVVLYVGSRASREVAQTYEFWNEGRGRKIRFNALLTTYEVILKDHAVLSNIKWNYLMVDEAHRLKNSEAALYTTLMDFSCKNKVLITGTPLQNSVEELWALLHFLDARKFNSKESFSEKYKDLLDLQSDSEIAALRQELRPHMLRRVIKDVEKSLPPKIERILRVEMSPLQRQYYKWILERNFRDLNKGVRQQVSLLNIVVELKKCCNHPFLFESADYGYGGEDTNDSSSKLQRMILSSGKLALLDKLLMRLKETGHRVLIFSQMVRMLDILAECLTLKGFHFQRLDGSTRADIRQQAMDHFNAPGSEDFCFLLSTRAGGLGINLATADTVIIFDSDWNPQNDLQAMSRAHRIGQQDVVNIYRFVTSGSVEEDILERAKKKMVLDHLVIQKLNAQGRLEKKETKKGTTMFDKNELAAILRFGAEDLFKEKVSEEEAKQKLENMDVDEILARAEKVDLSTSAAEGAANELLSAFTVANFSNTEDDATFWSKLIRPAITIIEEEKVAPRAARNVTTYQELGGDEDQEDTRKRVAQADKKKRKPAMQKSKDSSSLPVEGAHARVAEWNGPALSKKDATNFIKAMKRYGDKSKAKLMVKEAGGQLEALDTKDAAVLWEALINGCKQATSNIGVDAKGALVDFFGAAVKASDLLARVRELDLLARRVERFSEPQAQFRLRSHPRNPAWSKACAWTQVDDAHLLLGIYYHGFGNWETIRMDSRLGLADKIAPLGTVASETSLPRASNLDARANSLLRMELETDTAVRGGGAAVRPSSASKLKTSLKARKPRAFVEENAKATKKGFAASLVKHREEIKGRAREPDRKHQELKDETKEDGEISDEGAGGTAAGSVLGSTGAGADKAKDRGDEKGSRQDRWHQWCKKQMQDQERTLEKLQQLQSTSADLPKEKVVDKVKRYLKTLGEKIDSVLVQYAASKHKRMMARLWDYVAMYSNMNGSRLSELYKKLKVDENRAESVTTPPSASANGLAEEHGAGEPYSNGKRALLATVQATPSSSERRAEGREQEVWKRRRREEGTSEEGHHSSHEQPWERDRERRIGHEPAREWDSGGAGLASHGLAQPSLAAARAGGLPGGSVSRLGEQQVRRDGHGARARWERARPEETSRDGGSGAPLRRGEAAAAHARPPASSPAPWAHIH
eukprot:SM000092S24506  [mRNA]  locus=s92:280974:290959:- [translate_table: standard]